MKTGAAVQAPVTAKARAHAPRMIRVSEPRSVHERHADDAAERVLASRSAARASVPLGLPPPPASRPAGSERPVPASIRRVLAGAGNPLGRELRREMEMRFAHDFSRVRVFSGGEAAASAQEIGANAFALGNDIVFGAGMFAPDTSAGFRLLAHELAHVVQGAGDSVLFRDDTTSKTAPAVPKDDDVVAYPVEILPDVTSRAVFERYAETLIFGQVVNIRWEAKDATTKGQLEDPAKHVGEWVTFRVSHAELFRRGIPHASPDQHKAALGRLMSLDPDERNEIDRRYFESIGDKTGKGISTGEVAKSEIWRSFLRQYLEENRRLDALPAYARSVLGEPWELPLRDYTAAMPLVDRLATMSEDEVKDFRAITTFTPGKVTELAKAFETYDASKKSYDSARATRESAVQRLEGTEDVDRQIREGGLRSKALWERAKKARARDTAASGAATRHEWEPLEKEAIAIFAEETRVLDQSLAAHGFRSVADYRAALDQLESAFLLDAVEMVMALLARFEHRLKSAADQYASDEAVDDLLEQVGRSGATPLARQAGQLRAEADAITKPRNTLDIRAPDFALATRKRLQATLLTKQADALLGKVQGHPLLLDEEFPRRDVYSGDRKRAQKAILKHIAKRIGDIQTVRDDLRSSPKMIYKLPRVMEVALGKQGIQKGTFAYRIITGRQSAYIAKGRAWKLFLAVVAIALAFLSGGTSLLATAAAIGGAALGTYEAIEAIREYKLMSAYADVGFAEDPSLLWVVVAIVGAKLDLAQAIKKLAPVKTALIAFSKDTAKFADLAKAAEALPGQLREVVMKAAIAERRAAAALIRAGGAATGAAGGGFGMLKAVPAIAEWLFRKGVSKFRNFQVFMKEAEAVKLFGKAGLTGKELTEAKAAFDGARKLVEELGAHGKALRLTDEDIAGFLVRMQDDATLTIDTVRKAMSDVAAAKPKSPIRVLADSAKRKKRGPLDLKARESAAARLTRAGKDADEYKLAAEAEKLAESAARKDLADLVVSPKPMPASLKSDIERIEKIKSLDERIEALDDFTRASGKMSDEEAAFLDWRSKSWKAQHEAESAADTASHLRRQVDDANTRKAAAIAEVREESKDLIAVMRGNGPNYRAKSSVKVDEAMFDDHWKEVAKTKPKLATDHLVSLDRITKLPELDDLIALYTRATPTVKDQIKKALKDLGDRESNLMRLNSAFNSGVKNSKSWEEITFEVAEKRGGYTMKEVERARFKESGELGRIIERIGELTTEFRAKVLGSAGP